MAAATDNGWRVTVEPVGDHWATHRPVSRTFPTIEQARAALVGLRGLCGDPVTVDPAGKYRVTIAPVGDAFIPDVETQHATVAR